MANSRVYKLEYWERIVSEFLLYTVRHRRDITLYEYVALKYLPGLLVLFLGYVHTGPIPNGCDPILERTISVHTVPFRLSTSGHTGPVCYGSVLNRSKKSSCFYQLSMRRIHVVVFKMTPKYQKEAVQVFTR